jgi:predicted ABC-type transport system involved in lysophospholipase L1 biosynthesis ATPase subunit
VSALPVWKFLGYGIFQYLITYRYGPTLRACARIAWHFGASAGRADARRRAPQGCGCQARCIGFVFPRLDFPATLTSLQNVEIAMIGLAGAREQQRGAEELLIRVGMNGRISHYRSQVSAEERKRVATARSLANDPQVILADEPTGSMDTRSASSVIHSLMRIHAESGAAQGIVTHDSRVAAHARRQVTLEDGRIVKDEQVC